jgi:hypothetical protein
MIDEFPAIESNEAKEKLRGWGNVSPRILILTTKAGLKGRIYYFFNSTLRGAKGILKIGEHFFWAEDDTFYRYLAAQYSKDPFYKKRETDINEDVYTLFRRYNWSVDFRINSLQYRLPANLKHEAGEFPLKIYWAYNNELSKSIGLDFSQYLGIEITAEIYRLREPLPRFTGSRRDARGVIIRYQNEIIGAYIDRGRHYCFACSLERRSLEEITGMEWGSWIDKYINHSNEIEQKLNTMTPEQIIATRYEAVNNHNQTLAYACMSRRFLIGLLASNMDESYLFNKDYPQSYITGAKIIGIEEYKYGNPDINPPGDITYKVSLELEVVQAHRNPGIRSGRHTYYLTVNKETENGGYRIIGGGTGP